MKKRRNLYNLHSLQLAFSQTMFLIFHLKAHFLISFIILIKSSPLLVKEYSHLTGKVVESIFLFINPSFSNSFNLAESIFGVISGRPLFNLEYLFVFESPLYNSNNINNVHFFPIKFAV